ncbi:MAG: trigger factor, partial [Bdellovibrionales bacterium]|nr:trigger factor [Bdellovibrionales bacterium]
MATVEVLEGLSRKLTIDVPSEEVNKAFHQAYEDIRKTVNIKGFRKGKAPIAKIRSLYKDRVKGDVLNDLIAKFYQMALQEHTLEPINYPKIDLSGDFDEDQSLAFSAELEIRPSVVVENYEGLEVTKEAAAIDESKVDESVENIRKNMAEQSPVLEDRPAREGDIAQIDFDGVVDGQPLEGGSAKDHSLELGSKSFIDGFEEAIVGMKISDTKKIDLKFPDEYHAAEIAGKPVEFTVTLKKLFKKDLPELDAEFAKKLNAKFESIDDLKKQIRDDLLENEKRRIDEDLKKA